MKKKLIYAVMSSLTLCSSVYAIDNDYGKSLQNQELLDGQRSAFPMMFGKTLEEADSYTVSLEDKGDSWTNTADTFNMLDPDIKKTNTYVSNVNNNTYYLSRLVEGATPGAKQGGLIKQVSDINEEVNGYDTRISTAETKSTEAKTAAELAETKATSAATAASNAAANEVKLSKKQKLQHSRLRIRSMLVMLMI